MKYRILTLIILSISAWSVTDIAEACNGFYIGGDVGAADLLNNESHTSNPESHSLGSIGVVGGGYLGYDYGITHRVHLAIEGSADATGLQTSIQHSSATYRMNQLYNVGVRLLPQYDFTSNTSGHLIFGYVNGRFHIKDNGVYGLINKSFNSNGFQTGLGLTTALPSNFFVRIDALYNTYTSNSNRGMSLSGQGFSQIYKNQFKQLAGEISLYYKFI